MRRRISFFPFCSEVVISRPRFRRSAVVESSRAYSRLHPVGATIRAPQSSSVSRLKAVWQIRMTGFYQFGQNSRAVTVTPTA